MADATSGSVWKMWYDDGSTSSTFSSEEGKPAAAPFQGVQVIAELRDGQPLLHSGGEYYRYTNGVWRARPSLPDIKQSGPVMELQKFQALRREALEWLDSSPAS